MNTFINKKEGNNFLYNALQLKPVLFWQTEPDICYFKSEKMLMRIKKKKNLQTLLKVYHNLGLEFTKTNVQQTAEILKLQAIECLRINAEFFKKIEEPPVNELTKAFIEKNQKINLTEIKIPQGEKKVLKKDMLLYLGISDEEYKNFIPPINSTKIKELKRAYQTKKESEEATKSYKKAKTTAETVDFNANKLLDLFKTNEKNSKN